MRITSRWSLIALGLAACTHEPKPAAPDAPVPEDRATSLAQKYLIIDGHIDVPYRLEEMREEGKPAPDLSVASDEGNFDYPRASAGGLNAPFMSIYVPAKFQTEGGAKAVADRLIDSVEELEKKWPDKFEVARSIGDVQRIFAAKKVALPMGIENGAALEGKLENVKHFAERGVRYITLTHSKDNKICDSSYDETHTWKGLSPFGREVVAEMNRYGIMVDISHVSDDTFMQVLELSQAPVIASHSSCRHFTPGFERNMSDDMIRKLAEKGGVAMVNFGSSFISQDVRAYYDRRSEAREAFMKEQGVERDDPKTEAFVDEWEKKSPRIFADVKDVANHIDHIVKLVGIEHVGFGSDFDGVGDSLPTGLKDVSAYPNLIRELIARGYTDEDIEKICSKNVVRVWSAVEAYASDAQKRKLAGP